MEVLEAELNIVPDHREASPPKTLREKLRIVFTNITVEPILLCYTLPAFLSGLGMQNLNLDKACRIHLQYNESICDALMARNQSGYSEREELEVQKLVSSMNTFKNVMQSLCPVFVLLFVGSWSDRHKMRKPCMQMCLFGEVVACVGFIISTYFFHELPLQFNIVAEAVPPGITGGWYVMSMAIFSYISDITTTETRTVRIGAVHIFWSLSHTMGTAISGILCRVIGYYGIFSISLGLYAIAMVYATFFVKEKWDEDVMGGKLLLDLFEVKHIKKTFESVYRKGSGNRRAKVCSIMVLMMIVAGPWYGEINVSYLSLRYRFGWSEVEFSVYQTVFTIVLMLGNAVNLMVLSKFCKLDDALMGIMSTISRITSAFIFGLAPTEAIFYSGVLVEALAGVQFIALRSLMSKMVPADELGRMNSVFGVSEALMPLLYGPLYNIVYKNTVEVFPGAFYVMSGFLTAPSALIFYWLYKQNKKAAEEENLDEEQKVQFLKNGNLKKEHSEECGG